MQAFSLPITETAPWLRQSSSWKVRVPIIHPCARLSLGQHCQQARELENLWMHPAPRLVVRCVECMYSLCFSLPCCLFLSTARVHASVSGDISVTEIPCVSSNPSFLKLSQSCLHLKHYTFIQVINHEHTLLLGSSKNLPSTLT